MNAFHWKEIIPVKSTDGRAEESYFSALPYITEIGEVHSDKMCFFHGRIVFRPGNTIPWKRRIPMDEYIP